MAGIVDFIKYTQKKFQFLKWIQIVPQESLATKKSALYFVEKSPTTAEAIIVDDLGQKRKIVGGSGGSSFNGIETDDSATVTFTGDGTVGNPLIAESLGGGVTGDYIPLSGTEEGNPVTGDIGLNLENDGDVLIIGNLNPRTASDGILRQKGLVFSNGEIDFTSTYRDDYVVLFYSDEDEGGALGNASITCGRQYGYGILNTTGIQIQTTDDNELNSIGVGLWSSDDYSNERPEVMQIYAQRQYVINKINERIPEPPSTGTYTLQSVDGVLTWI